MAGYMLLDYKGMKEERLVKFFTNLNRREAQEVFRLWREDVCLTLTLK